MSCYTPTLLVTPAQLMRPGIDQNTSCALEELQSPSGVVGLMIEDMHFM